MESINFIKGYGKVNSESIPSNTINTRNRRRTVAIFLAVLITLIIAASLAALIHESNTEGPEPDENRRSQPASSLFSTNSTSSPDSLKLVCAVTQYPDSCFSSISALNAPSKPDPVHYFNLSIQVNLNELANLSSLPETLISKINDRRAESALKDCASLFDDSLSQLNKSSELMRVRPGEKVFTKMKISDIQTWISAAMTDQETCLDGLEEMGSTVVDEVRLRVQKSKEYMSNSLAILNNIPSLLKKFGITMP